MNHFKNHILSLILAVLFLLGAGAISFYAIFRGTPAFAEAIINPRTAPEAVAAAEPADNPDDPSGTTENDNPEAGKEEKNDKPVNEGDKTEDNEGSGNDKDDTDPTYVRMEIVKIDDTMIIFFIFLVILKILDFTNRQILVHLRQICGWVSQRKDLYQGP